MLYIIFSLNIFQLKMSHLKKQTKKIDVFSPRGIVSENVTCDQKNQMRFLLLIFFFSSFGIFTIVKIPCRARAQVDHLNLYFLLCVDLLTMPHMIFGNKRLLAHSIVTTTSTATTPCCFFPLNKDTVVSEYAENKQHHFSTPHCIFMPLTKYLQYFHLEQMGPCLSVAYIVSFFNSDSTLPQ